MSLTKAERETVILMDDESSWAEISTAQRTIITKLKNNPAAELIEERRYDGTNTAMFRLPAEFISFRTKKSTGRGRKAITEH